MRSVLLATAFLFLVCGCDVGGGSSATGGNSIRVTRDDGSQVKFSEEVSAWCGPHRHGDGRDRFELWVVAGQLPPEKEDIEPTTLWLFSRSTREIEREPRIKLPDEGEARSHASFFVYDQETGNELSSSEEAAKGIVEVKEWGCEKGDTVRIAVDATLDSEFHEMPNAKAVGEVEAVIGDPQPIPD